MSEEYYEEGNEELSAEELFQQRQAELEERFAEKGFFGRIGTMLKGLKEPRQSREYKEAITELQRLKAPIIAILLPVVGVVSLIVITAVQSQLTDSIQVDIATVQDAIDDLVEDEAEVEPEQELDMTQDTDVSIDVPTDVPQPAFAPAPPAESVGGDPNAVTAAPSPVTCAMVGVSVKKPGLGAGDGGFGVAIGSGSGGQNIDGCLIGIICDLKKDPNGKDNGYTKNGVWERLKGLNQGKFSKAAMSKYLVSPNQVALNKVYIPACQATEGPKAFGLKNCGDTGWCAFYSGDLKVEKKMRFRFVGYFDEFMLIRINGKVVFEAEWINGTPQIGGGTKPGAISGWVPSDKAKIGKHNSWQSSAFMVYGDWIDAEPGRPLKMELALGETAGGLCGGLLCVEVEGEKYEMKNGHPMLPVFSSRKLAMTERKKIGDHNYGFAVATPNFNAKGKAAKAASKNDVSVDVDI